MKQQKQTSFFDKKKKGRPRKRPVNSFGGMYFKNYNPMTDRPMNSRKALHVVLKSSLATGSRSFLNEKLEGEVWEIIEKHAKKNGMKLYGYANSGNHLHILMRIHSRLAYRRFIRSITGLIARTTMGAQRGAAKNQKFWDGRPFSRIVNFGEDFEKVKKYLSRNTFESIGWIPHLERSKKLSPQWKKFWSSVAIVSLPD